MKIIWHLLLCHILGGFSLVADGLAAKRGRNKNNNNLSIAPLVTTKHRKQGRFSYKPGKKEIESPNRMTIPRNSGRNQTKSEHEKRAFVQRTIHAKGIAKAVVVNVNGQRIYPGTGATIPGPSVVQPPGTTGNPINLHISLNKKPVNDNPVNTGRPLIIAAPNRMSPPAPPQAIVIPVPASPPQPQVLPPQPALVPAPISPPIPIQIPAPPPPEKDDEPDFATILQTAALLNSLTKKPESPPQVLPMLPPLLPAFGYPQAAAPPMGYPPAAAPPMGYPPARAPPMGYPPAAAPPMGYPQSPTPAMGYPPAAAPPMGYPSNPSLPPMGYPAGGSQNMRSPTVPASGNNAGRAPVPPQGFGNILPIIIPMNCRCGCERRCPDLCNLCRDVDGEVFDTLECCKNIPCHCSNIASSLAQPEMMAVSQGQVIPNAAAPAGAPPLLTSSPILPQGAPPIIPLPPQGAPPIIPPPPQGAPPLLPPLPPASAPPLTSTSGQGVAPIPPGPALQPPAPAGQQPPANSLLPPYPEAWQAPGIPGPGSVLLPPQPPAPGSGLIPGGGGTIAPPKPEIPIPVPRPEGSASGTGMLPVPKPEIPAQGPVAPGNSTPPPPKPENQGSGTLPPPSPVGPGPGIPPAPNPGPPGPGSLPAPIPEAPAPGPGIQPAPPAPKPESSKPDSAPLGPGSLPPTYPEPTNGPSSPGTIEVPNVPVLPPAPSGPTTPSSNIPPPLPSLPLRQAYPPPAPAPQVFIIRENGDSKKDPEDRKSAEALDDLSQTFEDAFSEAINSEQRKIRVNSAPRRGRVRYRPIENGNLDFQREKLKMKVKEDSEEELKSNDGSPTEFESKEKDVTDDRDDNTDLVEPPYDPSRPRDSLSLSNYKENRQEESLPYNEQHYPNVFSSPPQERWRGGITRHRKQDLFKKPVEYLSSRGRNVYKEEGVRFYPPVIYRPYTQSNRPVENRQNEERTPLTKPALKDPVAAKGSADSDPGSLPGQRHRDFYPTVSARYHHSHYRHRAFNKDTKRKHRYSSSNPYSSSSLLHEFSGENEATQLHSYTYHRHKHLGQQHTHHRTHYSHGDNDFNSKTKSLRLHALEDADVHPFPYQVGSSFPIDYGENEFLVKGESVSEDVHLRPTTRRKKNTHRGSFLRQETDFVQKKVSGNASDDQKDRRLSRNNQNDYASRISEVDEDQNTEDLHSSGGETFDSESGETSETKKLEKESDEKSYTVHPTLTQFSTIESFKPKAETEPTSLAKHFNTNSPNSPDAVSSSGLQSGDSAESGDMDTEDDISDEINFN